MNKVQLITTYSRKLFQTLFLLLEWKTSWYPQTENGTNSTLFKRPLDRLPLEKTVGYDRQLKESRVLDVFTDPIPAGISSRGTTFPAKNSSFNILIHANIIKDSSLWVQGLNNRRESHQESLSCSPERSEDLSYFPSPCNRKEMSTVWPSLGGTSDNPQQYVTRGHMLMSTVKATDIQCLNAFISVKAVSSLTSSLYSPGLTVICTGVRYLTHNNFVLKVNPPIKGEFKWLTPILSTVKVFPTCLTKPHWDKSKSFP